MLESLRRWLPLLMPIGFAVLEVPHFLKRRKGAKGRDRGSLAVIMLVIGGTFFAGFWIAADPRFAALRYDPRMIWLGLALFLAGAGVRGWAVRTLGRWFTPVVKVSSDQVVVEHGPYKVVRHPAYSGAILEALGMALATCNLLSLAVIVVAVGVALGYRIHIEEQALAEALGEPYRAYMTRTKRLIPFVY